MASVTYIPEFQVILSRRCGYACGYCDFPHLAALVPPSRKQLQRLLRTAARMGALQVTLTAGEGLEAQPEIVSVCRYYGYATWIDYVRSLCQYILERNGSTLFFPKLDIGPLSYADLRTLRPVVPMIQIMLESADDRLQDKTAHIHAPQKNVAQRMAGIEDACRAGIPVITGITVGIGESLSSWARAAELVSEVNARHGKIQVFQINPFYPRRFSAMETVPPVSNEVLLEAVRVVRERLDKRIVLSVQLQQRMHLISRVAALGVRDVGAVCLGTSEHVNFELPAELEQVSEDAAQKRIVLSPRMPFFDHYLRRNSLPEEVLFNVQRFRRLQESRESVPSTPPGA